MTASKKTHKKPKESKKSSRCKTDEKSYTVAIVSDIHFNVHDKPSWRAFRKWHSDIRPYRTIFLGDFIELNMLSSYPREADAEIRAIEQIRCFINEVNPLVEEADKVICIEGNHENRWNKIIAGNYAPELRGALGLTLREQCYNQGLDTRVEYLVEDLLCRGVKLGPFILRHGDKQVRGRFGGGKHLAANRIAKTLGESEIFGHFHRAQMFCQTANGRTAVAIANPCMTKNHSYSLDPDWQRGFTVLELFGPGKQNATAFPVLIDKGKFAYNGKVYNGNK